MAESNGKGGGLELYRKHRPRRFKDLVGQDEAVKVLTGFLRDNEVPHALVFTGGSGCGKTTAARILGAKLGCADMDFQEINTAQSRGIDAVRHIGSVASLAGMGSQGGRRLWLLDECHNLTSDGQEALLKMLEDCPAHAYYVLCTTHPAKLKRTILTRCVEVKFRPLAPEELGQVLTDVLAKEGKTVPAAVAAQVCESADGSARMALQLLQKVLALDSEEEQLAAVLKGDVKRQAYELAKLLVWGHAKKKWKEVAAVLKGLDGEDPEQVRRLVLANAAKAVLDGVNAPRNYHILTCFEGDFFTSGKAGLVRACWEAAGEG